MKLHKRQWEKAEEYLRNHEDEMYQLLEEMIKRPSCGREPEDVKAFLPWLRELFEKEGFMCREIDSGNENGNTLTGIWGEKQKGAPILFSGHMDTALYKKTAEENPYRMEGEEIHGSGVLDMKGGILIALFTVKALKEAGYEGPPIKICWSGDEEVNHKDSRGAQIMQEEARGCRCAFNMETGILSNQLCIGRKGGIRCKITVHGVSAHAGNDFIKGRSAIVEMAYKVVDIHNLTNLETGTTMNIGVINGGTIFNSVPDRCEAIVDMRFESNAEMEKGKEELEKVCRKTYIEGTSTEMEYIDIMHVFEVTEAGQKLLKFVQGVADEYGLEPVKSIYLGGSSDAAYTTMAGVPTLCSCGSMGQWNHTNREYIRKKSLLDRAKLWTAVILEMNE